jgi:hypothetical protein
MNRQCSFATRIPVAGLLLPDNEKTAKLQVKPIGTEVKPDALMPQFTYPERLREETYLRASLSESPRISHILKSDK